MTLATSKNLTYVGIAMIAGAIAAAVLAIFDGDPKTVVDWQVTVTTILGGIAAILGKGAASTGGTVPETPEAKARLAPPPATP